MNPLPYESAGLWTTAYDTVSAFLTGVVVPLMLGSWLGYFLSVVVLWSLTVLMWKIVRKAMS